MVSPDRICSCCERNEGIIDTQPDSHAHKEIRSLVEVGLSQCDAHSKYCVRSQAFGSLPMRCLYFCAPFMDSQDIQGGVAESVPQELEK